jgi:hypothetical protein
VIGRTPSGSGLKPNNGAIPHSPLACRTHIKGDQLISTKSSDKGPKSLGRTLTPSSLSSSTFTVDSNEYGPSVCSCPMIDPVMIL